MQMVFTLLMFVALFFGSSDVLRAENQVDVGISIGEEGLQGFHLSVGEYYRVPKRDITVVRKRGIPEEELPVVFFLAQRAHVAPSVIIDMRLSGTTWITIMHHYRLSPEILYVPVKVAPGPPYGKAYGHYKRPKKEWRKIVLDDNDVTNLVNLRFASDHHRIPPERVIEMRSKGRNFVVIDDDVRRERENKRGHEKGKPGKGGKGNGHGKGNHRE